MKKNLTKQELLSVSSMLFGLFFGAGNLIFPISMGQMAGKHLWLATAGFLITGVGLPLLVVAALGLSRKDGLLELGCNVGRRYGVFFTVLCYLTIGPFFAIPRCATVSYTVGMEQYVNGNHETLFLGIFSLLFFLCVLYFSLKPGEILTWVGKILNPLFLLLLALLLIRCMFSPMGKITEVIPIGGYASQPFFQGFLEGYNTMDAIAGLAFGIIVVNVIRSLGVKSAGDVAKNSASRRKWRDRIFTDRTSLLWKDRRSDSGRNGNRGMLKDGNRADHKLWRNICKAFSKWTVLSNLGDSFLCRIFSDRQFGIECDHHLFPAGSDVFVSTGDYTVVAGDFWQMVWKCKSGVSVDYRFYIGGSRS